MLLKMRTDTTHHLHTPSLQEANIISIKCTVSQKGNAHVTHFMQFCSATMNMPFATVLFVALQSLGYLIPVHTFV